MPGLQVGLQTALSRRPLNIGTVANFGSSGRCFGMAKIYIPTRTPLDWRALLGDPDKHWRAGYSAMAAAQSWEAAAGLPPEIAAMFAPDAELLLAIPEHKVPLPGRGAASQCDVFALVRESDRRIAVAVEAKVAEPFDRTIGDWMRNASDGKRARLSAICDLLGCSNPPEEMYYQLFHRTAAAIIEARRFGTEAAAMIVQSFSQEHRWYDNFAAFCDFLGASPNRNSPSTITAPCGMPLILGWATGDEVFLRER
ncbi:hypothetical protein SAMN04488093_10988 [Tropicibacter naphthalenivorans]|uniref:DUF6946 domain-containing protein n=2 Tax=Tropicibacter naphthalenivorans TaxID=441103 RepID=A0A0P1GIH4_9RHOB|nr:hypothetical protein TRN7648_03502 [Tropicibacter naphthalenivorans]SMD00121.1 hypothetical protein SAMN04488093_10988 [Tropicibacter naphthalenivorans]